MFLVGLYFTACFSSNVPIRWTPTHIYTRIHTGVGLSLFLLLGFLFGDISCFLLDVVAFLAVDYRLQRFDSHPHPHSDLTRGWGCCYSSYYQFIGWQWLFVCWLLFVICSCSCCLLFVAVVPLQFACSFRFPARLFVYSYMYKSSNDVCLLLLLSPPLRS